MKIQILFLFNLLICFFAVEANMIKSVGNVVADGYKIYKWFSSTFLYNEFNQKLNLKGSSNKGNVDLVTIGTKDGHVLYNFMIDNEGDKDENKKQDILVSYVINAGTHGSNFKSLEDEMDAFAGLRNYKKSVYVINGEPVYSLINCGPTKRRACVPRNDVYISYSKKGRYDWDLSTLQKWDSQNSYTASKCSSERVCSYG